VLHITNGDSVTTTMPRAHLAGDFLSWRDVLHEGPVPVLPPDELRRVRATYLATLGDEGADEIEAGLRARDERLAAALDDGERVVLWFEHDLFDQLQLAQILAGLPDRPAHVELICVNRFLGELQPDELAELWPLRAPVTPEQVRLARAAWDAVRGDDPLAVARMAATPDERLPYLAAALRRLLEELPAVGDGLARSERALMQAVADGARTREAAFVAMWRAEDAAFMGDTIAFDRLAGLDGLVANDGGLALTADGGAVLAGRADRVELIGFDRWLGGLHVQADRELWRWDAQRGAPTR
jgi:hypothetical protein